MLVLPVRNPMLARRGSAAVGVFVDSVDLTSDEHADSVGAWCYMLLLRGYQMVVLLFIGGRGVGSRLIGGGGFSRGIIFSVLSGAVIFTAVMTFEKVIPFQIRALSTLGVSESDHRETPRFVWASTEKTRFFPDYF